MAVDFSRVNNSCLRAFGQEFTYTRVVSSPAGGAGSLTAIPDTGAEQEESAPGDGSTYLKLWAAEVVAALGLLKGDEVSTTTTVYKIVDMQEDAGGGLWMLLRQDRAVV